MDVNEIRSFIGILKGNDKGLYVSFGGYTRNVLNEIDKSNKIITLLDNNDLIDKIIENYDNFDSETKLLLPLNKIYIPSNI